MLGLGGKAASMNGLNTGTQFRGTICDALTRKDSGTVAIAG